MYYKYILNVKQATLHIINGCCHSRNINEKDPKFKRYRTKDQVIAENQNHIKECKLCFRNR